MALPSARCISIFCCSFNIALEPRLTMSGLLEASIQSLGYMYS